jgi:hypothetical protein
LSILNAAPGSIVHRQMARLAAEVLEALGSSALERLAGEP